MQDWVENHSDTLQSTSPIIAWRFWELKQGLLYSVASSETCWVPCNSLKADKPSWYSNVKIENTNYHEGIYAYKIKNTCLITLVCYEGFHSNKLYAYGRVSLWGKVIEHEKGYRAEFAYPYDLYVDNPWTIRELKENYKVDVSHEPKFKREVQYYPDYRMY